MAPVRIGVIGAGLIGRRHLGVLLGDPAYQAAAIADPSPTAEALAKEHGIPYYEHYERMLDEVQLDGAIVATPNQLHVVAGLACIERRLPVLVEKPIASSVAEALELMAAADIAAVPVLTGHHRRHTGDDSQGGDRAGHGGRVPVAQPQARCLFRRHLAQGAGRRPGPHQRHPRDRLHAHAVR